MDDETAGADRQLGAEAGGKTKERRRVSGDKVIGKIKELIHVRRIINNMERPLALATVTVLFLACGGGVTVRRRATSPVPTWTSRQDRRQSTRSRRSISPFPCPPQPCLKGPL